LLKQRLKHQLGVRELGAMYGVDPGTISRRVAAARDRLAKATRAEMIRDLELATSEVSSILRLIDSQIDITLSTHDGPP
jgi:RNA polymerase sigma-70 factor (ECF subfamily)